MMPAGGRREVSIERQQHSIFSTTKDLIQKLAPQTSEIRFERSSTKFSSMKNQLHHAEVPLLYPSREA